MRQPKQVLVFPYKKNNDGNYLYAIFCRVGKVERWQGIAGGVEVGETLAYIHANDEKKVNGAVENVRRAYKKTKKKVTIPKTILGIIE